MFRRACLLLVPLMLAACSDTTSTVIEASTGGTVSSSSAEIQIPALSLAEDTEVAIGTADQSELPPLEGVRVIVDLEPRGTVLETPASLTISGSEIGAGDGESVSTYQLLDGWLPIEHQLDADSGDVTVTVTRFQPVGVVVSEAPTGGTIEGTIRWGSGDVVAMAPIELWMGDTMVSQTSSDANGGFRFTELDSGTYSLRVNYECMIDQAVGVAAGSTETVELTLCGG